VTTNHNYCVRRHNYCVRRECLHCERIPNMNQWHLIGAPRWSTAIIRSRRRCCENENNHRETRSLLRVRRKRAITARALLQRQSSTLATWEEDEATCRKTGLDRPPQTTEETFAKHTQTEATMNRHDASSFQTREEPSKSAPDENATSRKGFNLFPRDWPAQWRRRRVWNPRERREI